MLLKLDINFDYVTSLLSTYHILNAPTSKSKKLNPRIYDNLNVESKERKEYLGYLIDEIKFVDNIPNFIYTLISNYETLQEYFDKTDKFNPEIRFNLKTFEKEKFRDYFRVLQKEFYSLIEKRKTDNKKIIPKITEIIDLLEDDERKTPSVFDIRVVEGFSSSFSYFKSEHKLLFYESFQHFKDDSLNMIFLTCLLSKIRDDNEIEKEKCVSVFSDSRWKELEFKISNNDSRLCFF